ncbi:MAG: 2-phospho-L-lactate transferase [Pseudomonadota bacterium]
MSRMPTMVLCGGVGGARMANGFAQMGEEGRMLYVVNIGDDFTHVGLRICPDLDSVAYTLSGLGDAERGWGRGGETWCVNQALASLGGPTWFALGDKDIAWHLLRTASLAAGAPLSLATRELLDRVECGHRIVPVSDDPIATRIRCRDGDMAFQEWFVGHHAEPVVQAIAFEGAAAACLSPPVREVFESGNGYTVVLAPSNPFLSIDPLLAVPGMREAIRRAVRPVLAVSPIIGGAAVKGPLGKMLADRGDEVSPVAIARHYQGLADVFLIDEADVAYAGAIEALGMRAVAAPLHISDMPSQLRLARHIDALLAEDA